MPVTMPAAGRVVVVQIPRRQRRELEERGCRDRAAARCARAPAACPARGAARGTSAPPPCAHRRQALAVLGDERRSCARDWLRTPALLVRTWDSRTSMRPSGGRPRLPAAAVGLEAAGRAAPDRVHADTSRRRSARRRVGSSSARAGAAFSAEIDRRDRRQAWAWGLGHGGDYSGRRVRPALPADENRYSRIGFRLGNNGRLHGPRAARFDRSRVLVVDDDPATVDWLRMVVEQSPAEPPFEVATRPDSASGPSRPSSQWRPDDRPARPAAARRRWPRRCSKR